MTKTFKVCTIFSISAVWLVLMRIVFSYLNIGDYLSGWLFSFFVQVVGMGVIPLVLYGTWVKEDVTVGFSIRFRLHPLVYPIAILLGFLVSILLISTSAIWQTLLTLIGFKVGGSVGTVYPERNATGVFILELVTTAVLPGIFEELNYRGLGMAMFSECKNEKKVALLIGVLFGLGHQFVMQTGYAFVAGVVLALVALRTKSVVPGMIIHFINNAISVVSGYSEQRGGVFFAVQSKVHEFLFSNWLMLLLTTAVTVGLIVLLLRAIKKLSEPRNEACPEGSENYYIPDKMRYVDELFGKSQLPTNKLSAKPKWYEFASLYGATAIMALVTLFTFMWGMWR